MAAWAPNRYQRRPARSNASASDARISAKGEGTRRAVQEALEGDVVREVFGAIALGRIVGPDAAHVFVQGVAHGQRGMMSPLAVKPRPVRTLLALDLGARSPRELA